MKNLLVFTFYLFTCGFLIAQTKYENGYFINTNGQKIDCYIKNLRWLDAPNKVFYKILLDGEEDFFEPNSVKEFKVLDGPLYLSVQTGFPKTEKFIKQKSERKSPNIENKTAFIKQIVSGKFSLYQYKSGNDEVFLLQEDEDKPFPLTYKEYIEPGTNKIKKSNVFKQELLKYLDCSGPQSIQKLNYEKGSLINFVLTNNKCLGYDTSNYEINGTENKKANQNFKIIGGIMSYKFEPIFLNIEYENKITPTIGLEYEKFLPFNNNKWSFLVAPLYSYYSSSGYSIANDGSKSEVSTISISQITTNIGGRHYLYLTNDSAFLIDAALSLTNNLKREFTLANGIDASLTDIQPFYYGARVGIGYAINKKIQIGARYFWGSSINKTPEDKNNLKRVSVVFSYQL